MDALHLLRISAAANRLANARLARVLATLAGGEWTAQRTGFFPSLAGTLNHVLEVDAFYIAVLHGDAHADAVWGAFVPAASAAEWAARQAVSDERLIAWLARADAAALDAPVRMPRGEGRVQVDAAAHMLQHLFMHQTHHRGQAHAMLSGTAVAPPQLDEFLMPSEAHLRSADMAALGWSEAAVYHPPG